MKKEYSIGKVQNVNEKQGTARVKYEQFDGMISAELRVLQQGERWMPEIKC